MEPNTGATAYLQALWQTKPEKLMRADPVKLAAKYRIKPEWAAFWLRTRLDDRSA